MSWKPPHPVDPEGVDDLLAGAYDLHVHSGPDRRSRRLDALDLARSYQDAGLAGMVVKDHFLPTIGRAHVLNRVLPDFRCYSTAVLNASVGGLNPSAVEAALDAGVNWIIMPTVSAAAYRRYEGLEGTSRPGDDIGVLTEDGGLVDDALEVLDLLSGRDIVLASGHLAPAETLTLFREARARSIDRLVVTHASIGFLRMPIEIQREIAELGGVIEHAYVSCLFAADPVLLAEIWEQIQQVGVDSCYLASDLGQVHNPPPLHGWRALLGGLRSLGASEKDLRTLVTRIPERVIDGLPRYTGTWIPDGWDPDAVALR